MTPRTTSATLFATQILLSRFFQGITAALLFCIFNCPLKIDKNCPRVCPPNFSGRSMISNKKIAQSSGQHTGRKLELTDSKRRRYIRHTFLYESPSEATSQLLHLKMHDTAPPPMCLILFWTQNSWNSPNINCGPLPKTLWHGKL